MYFCVGFNAFILCLFFFFSPQVKITRSRERMMLWPSGLQILQIQNGWKVSISELRIQT